ncbi:MAG: PIN domain-containing protein [Acidimicrobiia bacterium]|nr:MAG: PIN domain-containing protein [Acidimicrobiia bacterium]
MRSTFIVVYDACVLHSAVLRDFLLRLAGTGLFQAKLSNRIIDEAVASVVTRRKQLGRPITDEQAAYLAEMMRRGIPDSVVEGYEALEQGLRLPDPDDRHVVAVAVRSGAQVIVTVNLADFPSHVLAPLDLEAIHPDQFVLNVLDLPGGETAVVRVLKDQSAALSRPPKSVPDLVDGLERAGLVASTARIRGLI